MKTLIYIIGIFFLLTSCYQQEFHPESGDLIFQVGIAGGMTEAIADATGGEESSRSNRTVFMCWKQSPSLG